MTGAQFIARVYQLLGLPAAHPEVTSGVIADNYLARVDELTLLVKPPKLRSYDYLNVVANSATILLPATFMQGIKVRLQATSSGPYQDVMPMTEEDLDGQDPTWQNEASGPVTTYSYAGMVETLASADYGKRILKLTPTPTTSITDGLLVRFWRHGTDLITGTNSQYQIQEVPLGYQLGLAHGVAGLIATDPRINRDPIAHLQIWQDMVQRYQHFGPEHREYDYQATGYSSVAQSQRTHWENQ